MAAEHSDGMPRMMRRRLNASRRHDPRVFLDSEEFAYIGYLIDYEVALFELHQTEEWLRVQQLRDDVDTARLRYLAARSYYLEKRRQFRKMR